jgi:tRNA (cytosine34-C5)-methyltransferase
MEKREREKVTSCNILLGSAYKRIIFPSFPSSLMSGKKRAQSSTAGFEVVPASADLASSTSAATTASAATANQPKKKQKVGVNSLRNAHANSTNNVSAHDKKANELWFRKAGYGPILFEGYYKNQAPGVVVSASSSSGTSTTSAASAEAQPAAAALPAGLSKGAKKKLKKKLAKSSQAGAVDEFQSFMDALHRPLPLAFRVRKCLPSADLPRVLSTLEALELTRPAVFDPDLAQKIYQTDPSVHKQSISKNGALAEHPLSVYVKTATASGILARQEIVSMLPVISLGVQPGEVCLDLCASPGSKTMQCMELLTTGTIVANDIHPQRVAALKDAIGRASLPASTTSRLLLSTHDGSKFPLPLSSTLLFDKVMTDVPCSGDGTIRKDKTILPRWNPGISNALHPLQLKIGFRGLELLKVGGLMCYSTCTFNPMENEAVVQEMLLKGEEEGGEGAVELVEWPGDVLPGLVRRPGVCEWRVADYEEGEKESDGDVNLRWWDNAEQAKEGGMSGYTKTLWPNPKNRDFNMHYCNRLVPQDPQDTGGFFVALLRKNKPFKSELAMSPGETVKGGEHEEVYRMLQSRRRNKAQ